LSEADRKEKKKQRLLKASHDARMRAKAAKAEEAAYQVTGEISLPMRPTSCI